MPTNNTKQSRLTKAVMLNAILIACLIVTFTSSANAVTSPESTFGIGDTFMSCSSTPDEQKTLYVYPDPITWTNGIEVKGNYAYVGQEANFQVVNVSDPYSPFLETTLKLNGDISEIIISENYAYVLDWRKGFFILDISNPTLPIVVGHNDSLDNPWHCAISNDLAYIADGSRLTIMNITDPSSPSIKGSFKTPGPAIGVDVYGNHAYVTDLDTGLIIINVTNPSEPSPISIYDGIKEGINVIVLDNYAYIAAYNQGLQIINISDPYNPSYAGSCNQSRRAFSLDIHGNYAYVGNLNGEMKILDISDPYSPVFIGGYYNFGDVFNIYYQDNFVYVADRDEGIVIINVTEPQTPELASIYRYLYRIQDAVNAANDHDTILVYPGTYAENINVDKPLNISSIGGPLVTNITVFTSEDHVFDLSADNISINGFTISGTTKSSCSGIYITSSENQITRNIFTNNSNGVYCYKSTNNSLNNNIISNNSNGIYCYKSTNDSLNNNIISNNSKGIYCYESTNNSLNNNILSNNSNGIYCYKTTNNSLNNNIVSNNSNGIKSSCTNNESIMNNTFENNKYGLWLDTAKNSTILKNYIDENNIGVWMLGQNTYNLFDNNTLLNNTRGFHLEGNNDFNSMTNNTMINNEISFYFDLSFDNTISNNIIKNSMYGFRFQQSGGNLIENNSISENTYGILLLDISANRIFNNTFTNNSYRAIYSYDSYSSHIIGNTISGSGAGVVIYVPCDTQKNVIINNNTIFNTNCGIKVNSLVDSQINNNLLYNNTCGIALKTSSHLTVANNMITNNLKGVSLSSSVNNSIYNNFFNNTNNLIIDPDAPQILNTTKTNKTNVARGPFIAGNYWLDPNGTGFSQINNIDVDEDGICDVPYQLSELNIDYLPLAAPITMPPACISNLTVASRGATWINWTWNNPENWDFNHTMIHVNSVFITNTSNSFFNHTALKENTTYTLEVFTVDASENMNSKSVAISTSTQFDWNPWNDQNSEGNFSITTRELQVSINCWIMSIPAPATNAKITTIRMQQLINDWINT